MHDGDQDHEVGYDCENYNYIDDYDRSDDDDDDCLARRPSRSLGQVNRWPQEPLLSGRHSDSLLVILDIYRPKRKGSNAEKWFLIRKWH